jgi:PPOX class probable F420-dependent enzyme
MTVVPESHLDLLERPLYGHVGTRRPDGSIQVNPMWFLFDGEHLRLTHTTTRQKYRNIEFDPHVSLSVNDPEAPYRYLEVRGTVVEIEKDPNGEFFQTLARRYSLDRQGPPPDAADRVVLVVAPTAVSFQ